MIRRLSYLRRVGRKSQRGYDRVITVCIYNLAEIDRASLPRDILGPIRGPPAHCLASTAPAEAGLVASPPALCSPCVSGDATAGLTGSEFQTPPAAAGAALSHAHCQVPSQGNWHEAAPAARDQCRLHSETMPVDQKHFCPFRFRRGCSEAEPHTIQHSNCLDTAQQTAPGSHVAPLYLL